MDSQEPITAETQIPARVAPTTREALPSTASPSSTVKVKGDRIDKHGFIYLTLTGTPQEMGYAHGFLLADRIVKMVRTYAFFVWTEYGRDITFFAQMIKDLFEPIVKEQYNDIYLEMINIAKGVSDKVLLLSTQEEKDAFFGKNAVVGNKIVLPDDACLDYENSPTSKLSRYTDKKIMIDINFDLIFLLNCIVSLDYVYSKLQKIFSDNSSLKQSQTYSEYYTSDNSNNSEGIGAGFFNLFSTTTKPAENDRCSAFMAVGNTYTAGGKIVCAHITFDNYVMGQFDNIILFLDTSTLNTPEKPCYNILMQTFPGGIFSMTDFFVTSAKIVGTETTIGGFNAFELHAPACVRCRKAMQYSGTLDEFLANLVENNSGDYANTWYIGHTASKDAEGKERNEIMRIELGLKYRHVEKKTDGYFIGFNACYDPRIRNLECVNDGFFDIRRHSGARRVTLDLKIKEYTKGVNRISVNEAQEIISNHWDLYLQKDNMCSRTICAHYDLDPREYMSQESRPKPYQPRGAMDAKICSSDLCNSMQFLARWGSACGTPFMKDEFCDLRHEWNYQRAYLENRPKKTWVTCTAMRMQDPPPQLDNAVKSYAFEKSKLMNEGMMTNALSVAPLLTTPLVNAPDVVSDLNRLPPLNNSGIPPLAPLAAAPPLLPPLADQLAPPLLAPPLLAPPPLAPKHNSYKYENNDNDNDNDDDFGNTGGSVHKKHKNKNKDKEMKEFNKIFKNNKKSYKIKNTNTRKRKSGE
jgi:hypothetical protein